MAKEELLVITDGTYTLEEMEETNKFRFFRNDGENLGKVDDVTILTFLGRYLLCLLKEGKVPDRYEVTRTYRRLDEKCIIINLEDDLHRESKKRIINFV